MDLDIPAELGKRQFLRIRCLGLADGVPCFQRKFGVDDQIGSAIRHADDTIRPASIGKRSLELIGPLRQAIGNDGFHACLTESAARLLVGENRLQLDNLPGQRLDIVLRGIDDRQPLLQFGQVFMGRLRLFRHGLADAAGHAVEALADRLVELRLARTEKFRHGLHAALHLRLALQDLGHPYFRITRTVFRLEFRD